MVNRKIKDSLSSLNKKLHEKGILVNKIILFGSYSEGKVTEESDVDVVIVSKDFDNMDFWERIKIIGDVHWELVQQFDLPMDIITVSLKEWEEGNSLIVQSAKGGKVIYG